jgi:hypothetical protein
MAKKIDDNGKLEPTLTDEIAEKLNEGETQAPEEMDIDVDKMIKDEPLQAIAYSLYHIERTLKGMLYIQNTNADSGLSYNRDHFFAIFGGTDPEVLQQEEIARLKKADAEAEENAGE